MKFFVGFIALLLLAVFTSAQEESSCRAVGRWCTRSEQCCTSYCRDNRCLRWGTIPAERGRTNPCSLVRCGNGPCVVRQVRCPNSPQCAGQARCVNPA